MISFRKNFKEQEPMLLVDWLASHLPDISKIQIKKVMNQGGAWLRPAGRKKLERVRFAKHLLKKGDYIEFYCDPELELTEELQPIELFKNKGFGIWYKPAGMMTQGNKLGDLGSLLRTVEKLKGKAFLVHRLDKNTAGLVCMAYDGRVAGELSKLWSERNVQKFYRAWVLGETPTMGIIDQPLDDQEAFTSYRRLKTENGMSLLDVEIETGRMHQIRRHMEYIGHPVMGDNKYGKGNKNKEGIQLIAYRLVIEWQGQVLDYQLPENFCPF